MNIVAGKVRAVFTSFIAVVLVTCLCLPSVSAADRAYALESGDVATQAGDSVTVGLDVTFGQTEARSMRAMINEFRTGSDAWEWNSTDTEKVIHSGLSQLTYDYELERAAMQRAVEIAVQFEHTRPDGSSFSTAAASGWTAYGENIAAGQRTASEAFTSWQETNDPYAGQGHRRNMLSEKFTSVGIGHVICNGYHYWVQEFSKPQLDATATAADDSQRTVSVDIANSIITQRNAKAAPDSITLSIGGSADLPKVTSTLLASETWPARALPVQASASAWSSDDAAIAEVSDGKVVAKAAGSTILRTTVDLGEPVAVSVPVAVKAQAEVPLDGITVQPKGTPATYTGKAIKPAVTVSLPDGTPLVNGADFEVSYANNVEVGTAQIIITGINGYTGSVSVPFKIKAKANTLKASAKAKTVNVSYAKVKKGAVNLKRASVINVSKARGAVEYGKAKGTSSRIAVSKAGVVKVKQGTKKGSYKVNVTVTANGGNGYAPASKTVSFKVLVR